MLKSSNAGPLKDKIALIEGVRQRDSDKIYGISPEDYNILLQLGKICKMGGNKEF